MKISKIVTTGALANIFEWYDYSLFGSLAYLIGEKFFAAGDVHSNILNAFMVFAVGYIMRPIGGGVFGLLGDKFGRKFALFLSVIFMSVPTTLVGIMPTYEDIGIYSTIILVLIRMLQGLSMGGVLTGSIAFLIEHAPENRKGLIGSITAASICTGILLGNFICFAVAFMIGEVNFASWGWRIPFLLGVVNIFVGIYIFNAEETPEYLASSEVDAPPTLLYVFKNHLTDMIMSILINATGSVIFYFQVVFAMNFLKINRGLDESYIHLLGVISLIIMGFSSLIAGYISDIYERRKVLGLCAITSFFASIFIVSGLQHGGIFVISICQIILAILTGFYLGPEPALQAEFYPAKIRSTALSISYNTSTSIFGGATPLIVSYLYGITNSLYVFSLYVLGASLLSLIGLYYYKPAIVI